MLTSPDAAPSSPGSSLSDSEVNKLSDQQAWDIDEDVLCRAARKSWRSDAYDHYEVSRERLLNEHGERYIRFKFTCKIDPQNHNPHYRARKDTSQGTNNLQRGIESCNKRTRNRQAIASTSPRQFSPARLRAILALWSARNHRPFELVQDELFRMLIDELRLGTLLPDRTTLSDDVRSLYKDNTTSIRQYFENVDYIHLALDGWTAPTSRSYLGAVVVWQRDSQLYRAILEFILLKRSHTGVYLAQKTAEVLDKYNLGSKLLTVCMDNAGNNNTFTDALREHFPSFGGALARVRCAAHIVNLMAKAYLSVFFASTKQKRAPKAAPAPTAPAKRVRTSTRGVAASASAPEPSMDDGEQGSDDESDSETEDTHKMLAKDNVDEAKTEHDAAAVKECIEKAYEEFEKEFKISIPASDRRMAEQLIPKIAGLAKRAHKSAVVQHRFEEYVAQLPSLSGSKRRALARRMATRWNTDLECIRSHVYFEPAVKLLVADRDLSLKRFELSNTQWRLAERLVEELKKFERLTNLFSETQVPSIHQVVPALLKLQDKLLESENDKTLPPVLRVAARAAIEVFNKYMRLFETSGIYWVALVMCPTYKLEWFRRRKYSETDIQAIKNLVTSMFVWMSGLQSPPGEHQTSAALTSQKNSTPFDDWLSDDEDALDPGASQSYTDTIEEYLSTPPLAKETLHNGGLLKYWQAELTQTPRIAKFALGILSAPASSVDAERAFSGGRLTINHLQHSMSELTFEAKMAVGSWYKTPLLPSVDIAASYLSDKMGM
ncbi:hypothetical protein FRC09_002881 [Ceratobasidium sp. 395]|nr:hypothetical protein FRC09_002881 [Ceratobasidium sp. 395]